MSKEMTNPEPASRTSGLSRAQKAAIILSLLGEGLGKRMVGSLEPADFQHVVSVMATVPRLSRSELKLVVIDFLSELEEVAGGLVGGKPMVERFRRTILNEIGRFDEDSGASSSDQAEGLEQTTWSLLQSVDPGQIADFLNRLPPNLIASALRRIEADFAARIIARLDETRLGPTLSELLSDLRGDPEFDDMVEQMLAAEFLSGSQAEEEEVANAQMAQIGEVLSLLPTAKREKLLDFLRQHQAQGLERVERKMLDIAQLAETLPKKYVPVLVREFEQRELASILKVLSRDCPGVFDFILSSMPSRSAENIRFELNEIPDIVDSEADAVIGEFTRRLIEMRRNNLIEINTNVASSGKVA